MGYRVVVNFGLCESNALCMGVAPDVFEVGDDDQLRVLVDQPGDEARPAMEQAVRLCPKQAITLVDS